VALASQGPAKLYSQSAGLLFEILFNGFPRAYSGQQQGAGFRITNVEEGSHTMLTTIIGALLPIVVILLLGFFSGWHQDFTGDQATILNRMVMLYALPLPLFGSTVSIFRTRLLENVPLALAVAAGMVGSSPSRAYWRFRYLDKYRR
jgi:hypothetical protein